MRSGAAGFSHVPAGAVTGFSTAVCASVIESRSRLWTPENLLSSTLVGLSVWAIAAATSAVVVGGFRFIDGSLSFSSSSSVSSVRSLLCTELTSLSSLPSSRRLPSALRSMSFFARFSASFAAFRFFRFFVRSSCLASTGSITASRLSGSSQPGLKLVRGS